MNRLFLLITCLSISLSLFSQKIANEIILSTSSKISNTKEILRQIKTLNTDINYVELKTLCKSLDIFLLTVESISGKDYNEELVYLLANNNNIAYAYPNEITHSRAIPNDSRYPNQWNLDLIKATEAWDITKGGTDYYGNEIVIAIMDDGFDADHEDIQSNLWVNSKEIIGDGIDNDLNGYVDDEHGIDLDSDNGDIDVESHGTSVMGIVGADSDNNLGITGINWNTKLMVLSSVTNEAKVIAGYDYILQMRKKFNENNNDGAYIVATNYSLGIDEKFGENHPAWCGMYDELGAAGIVSVGATTNKNNNVDEVGDLPTTCGSPYFIGVTNTDRDDIKVTNAGFGEQNIDLSAPGKNTETFKPESEYGTFGGTSASAPHVAGALGLLYTLQCKNLADLIRDRPGEAALRIKQAILDGTDPLVSLDAITATGGRLNILKSMSELTEFCSSDPTIPISGPLAIDFIGNNDNGIYTIYYKSPDTQSVTLDIYDLRGKKLYSIASLPGLFTRSREEVDLSKLASGIYIATVRLGEKLASYKFRHITTQ